MNNSENHAIIYHKLSGLFVDLNMMIAIVLMCYMLDNIDYYLNEYISYWKNYRYYHSFLVYDEIAVSHKKNHFFWGEARFPPYTNESQAIRYPPMLLQPHNETAAPQWNCSPTMKLQPHNETAAPQWNCSPAMIMQPHNCQIGAKILIDIWYVKLFNK
jgi:hypothetical protein